MSTQQTDMLRCSRVCTDPVHGLLRLPDVLWRLVDTAEFQRLRGLKQLGAVSYVYPSAQHTRFEHSLGVAHLAFRLSCELQRRHPDLVSEADILCVSIAGLCHDLGHGPLSHTFEQLRATDETWKHEKGSVTMLEHLLRVNSIDLGLGPVDMVFIKEIILGKAISPDGDLGKRVGRPRSRWFLYDMINNESSGFDLDKLDYLQRDCNRAGFPTSCDFGYLIAHMEVVRLPGSTETALGFPDKCASTLLDMFRARYALHKLVYQHKGARAAELMLLDVLDSANDSLSFPVDASEGAARCRMSEAHRHPYVFSRLKDSVLDLVEHSEDTRLSSAQALLRRLQRRDLYVCCGTIPLCHGAEGRFPTDKPSRRSTVAKIKAELLDAMRSASGANGSPPQPFRDEDLRVELRVLSYGKGGANPLDSVLFFAKGRAHEARRIDTGSIDSEMPRRFEDIALRVFCCDARQKNRVCQALEAWSGAKEGGATKQPSKRRRIEGDG